MILLKEENEEVEQRKREMLKRKIKKWERFRKERDVVLKRYVAVKWKQHSIMVWLR